MTEAKPTRTVRRGKIFSEIQWCPEKIARREAIAPHSQQLPTLAKLENWLKLSQTTRLSVVNKSKIQNLNPKSYAALSA